MCVFVFDIIYYNGEPLLKKTLKERREILRDTFIEEKGRLLMAKAEDSSDAEALAVCNNLLTIIETLPSNLISSFVGFFSVRII